MNTAPGLKALIIDSDIGRAVGLRHLFARDHDIEATITAGGAEAVDRALDNDNAVTLYVVSPEIWARYTDRLIGKRVRVAIIGVDIVTADVDEEALSTSLSDFIGRFNRTVCDISAHGDLSPREIQVLKLVASGYINKEIAEQLNISFNTVLTHRRNISSKLGIKSTSGLAIYAMMHGYVQ